MLIVAFTCLLVVAATTLIHYQVLENLSNALPTIAVPRHMKLLVAVFAMLFAHVLEIAVYGLTYFLLIQYTQVGTLSGSEGLTLMVCVYFSMEMFTSLGFGDITPLGPIRFVAGVEALNGLLLIGWSASFLYIAMERYWNIASRRHGN